MELTSLETTSTMKGGNKISETLRSKLSGGVQKNCSRGLGETSDNKDWDLYLHCVTPHAQRERGKVIDRGVHIIIYTSETHGKSTGVVISITQYFGIIFDALITHKVVVIVIVFFFHCLSIGVALFLLKLVSHVFACVVHYYFVS